jgi:hypothetical protein
MTRRYEGCAARGSFNVARETERVSMLRARLREFQEMLRRKHKGVSLSPAALGVSRSTQREALLKEPHAAHLVSRASQLPGVLASPSWRSARVAATTNHWVIWAGSTVFAGASPPLQMGERVAGHTSRLCPSSRCLARCGQWFRGHSTVRHEKAMKDKFTDRGEETVQCAHGKVNTVSRYIAVHRGG